jgi:MFS family permease
VANFLKPIFLSAYFGMLLFGVSLTTLGSIAPVLQEKFSMDALSFGALFSMLPFGILSGSLLFGPFADRYGYKIIFVLAGLAMFTGFQGIAYAPTPLMLKLCVFVFGLGGGALNGGTNAVVSDISDQNRAANLSLLGVFFAVGALGMPFILGVLQRQFTSEAIVASVGYLALCATTLFLFTRFPDAKQAHVIFLSGILRMFKDSFLLLVGFFLFCQSSFEAIINNWTTTYILHKIPVSMSAALYALSMYVVGMAATRILLGKLLRKVSPRVVMFASIALLAVGSSLLHFSFTYNFATAGLVIIGAGLAAGFPVTLGFVGDRYAAASGTAFSMVISIGLVGSMIVNYVMGMVVELYGIQHLVTMIFILTALMLLFSIGILRKLSIKKTN